MNDSMIKWMTAGVRLWNAMSNARATLVAASTWGAEPAMCQTVLGWIDHRRCHPPKTPWDRMMTDAREADVDPLDEAAFEAFKRAWFEAYDREHEREANMLRRWAAETLSEDE